MNDLENIRDYISKDSINYAVRFVEKIITNVDKLINFPQLGRIVPEFEKDDSLLLIAKKK